MDERPPSRLSKIPPEIWVKILSYLNDFKTLHHFKVTSRSAKQLIDRFESILFYQISLNLGYIDPCSFGSSKTIYSDRVCFDEDENDNQRFGPSQNLDNALLAAKVNQRTNFREIFDPINSWKQFAMIKHKINKRWDQGLVDIGTMVMITPPYLQDAYSPIWRWKFDPDYQYWAMTSAWTGLTVVSSKRLRSGALRIWHSSISQNYSHLESSGPYLITTNARNQFLIWKRQDHAFDNTEEDEQPSELQQDRDDWPGGFFQTRDLIDPQGRVIGVETFNKPMFKLFLVLDMPQPANCFKARSPFLAAGSISSQQVYVWNLDTGTLVEQYDVSERASSGMFYIELDQSFVFLGGSSSINVYDRRGSEHVYAISGDLYRGPGYTMPSEWVAVHHDVQGRQLIALSRNRWLLWTPRYTKLITSTQDNREPSNVVLMNLDLYNGEGNNLCVENNRAVFSIVVGGLGPTPLEAPFEMLFLLKLQEWNDEEDFIQNPPRLISILKVIPSFESTSRIEMDSCGIYLTSIGIFLSQSAEISQAWETLNDGYRDHRIKTGAWNHPWFNRAGDCLCYSNVIDPKPRPIENVVTTSQWFEASKIWADYYLRNHNRMLHLSSILYLSFVEEESFDQGVRISLSAPSFLSTLLEDFT